MHFSSLLALASAVAVQAVNQGFNYGATNSDGSFKVQSTYEAEFKKAQNLPGTSGFTSARLYTMIQGGTANTVTSAIPAAISTKTGLLLGLWASAGQDAFNNEIAALKAAIDQYGSAFTSLVEGISIGSEDLYRNSETGIINKSGIGAQPDTLVQYINQVRSALSGTALASAGLGHVDTWTAWVNGSNSAVIDAVDWIGMDGYPYFQNTQANSIDNGASLFFASYQATVDVSKNKPVWITETGWPVSGPTENLAVPSTQNAQKYWRDVACKVLGVTNTYWYTLQDAYPTTPSPSFGIIGSDINSAPLYDLSCPAGSSSSSASSATSSSTASATAQSTPSASSATTSIATAPGPQVTPSASASASSPASGVPGQQTFTTYSTTLITITACSAQATTLSSAVSSATKTTTPAPASSGCPANLKGTYEYPHLIVPVDSANPDKAYGTSYNGTITPAISSLFNFDIPPSYAGKTCTLVFLFPQLNQLETSSYSFNGKGGLQITGLASPATEQTTYKTVPQSNGQTGAIAALQPGNSYTVLSGACPAGQRIGYEFSSSGGLDLNFFQDYNPSPLGAYITVC